MILEAGALAAAIAVGLVLIATKILNQAPSTADGGGAQAPLFVFPAGRQRAAAFVLRDQDGRPVSLAAYRGKPVIVTFVDPLCRNLCPLAAHVLDVVDHQLPAARRVPILAVSVDVYADTRRDLLQDFNRWSLVPNWRWAIGSPAQLAAVWKAYDVQVSVITRKAAGVTAHIIQHEELAYVLDAHGYERALFGWPYSAASVERTLAMVSRS